ncbi:zinc finger MYM-type protein 1-like [Hydra vulgaris]|uniref:Zinc finger MYM-type protein 1-like n=1 Tax=Hydra vulgaris TaxID=6087 RepID=A0ABM4BNS8_HYDVU
MNKIDSLLAKRFSSLGLQEKLEIKNLGAYQPKGVRITQVDGKKTRTFCVSWFEKKSWLSVSDEKNSLFCFYCVLFGGESLWAENGCKDMKHLSERIQKHESSKTHISNSLQFQMLGKTNILSTIDAGYSLSIKKHNELVDKNRHTLSRVIDCIKFCGVHELPLRGHDETIDSNNRGVFLDMVSYTATLDSAFSDHLKDSKITKNTSKTNQNEILECMYKVYIEEIKREIDKARFVSLQADETTDVSCRSQFVIILRYLKGYQPVERFIAFIDVQDRTAMGLTNVLKEELNCFGLKEKLIAQAYDGAAVMSGSRNGVQSLMKEVYPNAHYVHCYAHQLNLVLKKVCSSNKRVRTFFSTLSGFGVFFTSSPKRNDLLREITFKQIPRVCETRWNFRSKIVTCIKENKTKIGECFDKIINDEGWDDTSVWQSVGFKKCLEDLEFNFFLSFFYSILKHVDVLYNILQSSNSNTITIKEAFEKFELSINFVRNSITDNVSGSILNDCEEMHENRMKRNTSIELLIEDAKDACDKVIYEISDRFRSIEIFKSFSILDPKNFKFNRQHFPRNHIKNILTNYPMLSEVKLMSELTVLYENAVFSDIGTINALSQFMHENNLIETFSEVSKLIEIVLVTPVSTADAERCFSTLKRIKTLLRNSTGQDRLNALAVLSIHKDYLQDIDQFNQKVIEMFSLMKQRRAEYLYK